MSRCPWQASVRLTSSGPGTRPSHLPTPDAAPNPAPDPPPWPVFRRGCGRGRRVEPAMLCCSKESQKHRGGAGAGAGPALEDPLGAGPVTLREPEGSPQAFQSINSLGCLPPRGRPAEQTRQRGRGEGAQEAFCRSRGGGRREGGWLLEAWVAPRRGGRGTWSPVTRNQWPPGSPTHLPAQLASSSPRRATRVAAPCRRDPSQV